MMTMKKNNRFMPHVAGAMLLPQERTIFKARPHWLIVAIPEAVLAVLGYLVTSYLSVVLPNQMPSVILLPVLFGIACCFLMAVILLDWIFTSYYLTNLRLIKVRGIIGRRAASIGLHKVQDVTYRFSVWGRIFGFGNIEIESAGTYGKIVFEFLPGPQRRWKEIERAIFTFRSNQP
jgi:uncharacterized membrane protein YdbT with pleckstrin-like domain